MNDIVRRGRPPASVSRPEDERRERRRRKGDTLDRMSGMKLAIPEEVRAAHADKHLRWVNDQGTRMHDLTVLNDFDKVEGVPPVVVGTDERGKEIKAYLCAKPLEFHIEDQAEKVAKVGVTERMMERNEGEHLNREYSYAPTGNKIRHGSG